MRKTQSEIPDSIECQGPDILVPEFWKLLTGQSIGYNLLYFLIQAEIIEELVRHVSGKSDPILISAYVLDTQPDFLCSFHP